MCAIAPLDLQATAERRYKMSRRAGSAACPNCSNEQYGLRHTAGAALAEAGCSEKEIMAVLGHKNTAS